MFGQVSSIRVVYAGRFEEILRREKANNFASALKWSGVILSTMLIWRESRGKRGDRILS